MTKIVVLDGYTLAQDDLSWTAPRPWRGIAPGMAPEDLPPRKKYDLIYYPRTKSSELIARAKDADILVTNKVILDRAVIKQLPKLKYICISATGYNNVDLEAAKEHGILVSNVVGYGTLSVAQHVFAMILHFSNGVAPNNLSVQAGEWNRCPDFSYSLFPMIELQGCTLGIYGLGQIGNRVADIALAMGMLVLAHHKHPKRDAREGIHFVSLEEMAEQSRFITFHAPLNESNRGIADANFFAKMRKDAYLINTSRGGLVNEIDLKNALENGEIAGAALDVLSKEPPVEKNVLMGVKNCIITPHQAWATYGARARLMHFVLEYIEAFLNGHPINIINEEDTESE